MFANINRQKQCAFVVVVVVNSSDMFNVNELKAGHSMNSSAGVWDIFVVMQATPRLFKTLTNFTLAKFDKLALLMEPTIVRHAQSTCEHHIQVLDLGFTLKNLF